MVIEEFSKNIVPILQLLVSSAGVVGIILLWYQIKSTHQWNKASSQHALLSNLPNQDHEATVWKIVDNLEKSEDGSITENASKEIYSDIDTWTCIRFFLNKFEQLCAAVNANALDDSYAYSVHSAKVTNIFQKFRNYIEFSRIRLNDDEIYIELEVVASRWHQRYLNTKEVREKRLADAKKALDKELGVNNVVP
ncbi:DUF4760 domain-containing protein [Microbulbifer sp. CNSA002]|uniref:DUF4760 domain-containing protein n=1 Tax=Microbulbifer sp. CNSA002 TaxID=3373604 RepID=UPI0039B6E40F